MSITADQERRYYDDMYAPHLARSDDDLRLDRRTLLADLDDPSKAIYERRRLFHMVFGHLDGLALKDLRVLDYGCGPGDWGLWMAAEGAHVTFLDLSPMAVELCIRRARASGVDDRAVGVARDASDLSCFADGAFDLVFGGASIHHTMKYTNALQELSRVLKPGGQIVLAETLGANPARRLCAAWINQSEDAGEEILLGEREFDLLRIYFQKLNVTPVNLLAMGKRLLRGRFGNPAVRALMRTLESFDSVALAVAPFLRRYCGEALIVAVK